MVLEFTEVQSKLICATPKVPSSENPIKYVKCMFHFTTRPWLDATAITATFKSASYAHTEEIILDSSGSCYMPVEIYKYGGVVQVILEGDYYNNKQQHHMMYLGPANVFFGRNNVTPTPLPSKYDIFVAEFTNIKQGLDASAATIQELIDNFNDIDDAYLDDDYHLVIKFSNGDVYTSEQSLRGPKGDVSIALYADLPDKPSVEGVELDGDKSFEDLGLKPISSQQIIDIVNM